jgi:AcrR family transcriptional regulator
MTDVGERTATAGFTALTRHDRRKMAADEAARHQRRRILEAITELVVARGYGAVSVAEIVARARVSKSAFYREFTGKPEAFGASVEAALAEERERVDARLSARGTSGLGPALEEIAAMIAADETRARLVFLATVEVDAAVGRTVREEASRRYRLAMANALEAAGAGEVPETHLVGLVGGIEEIVYRRLHDGKVGRLGEDLALLAGWALGYAEALGRGELIGARLLGSLGERTEVARSSEEDPIWDWRADLSDPAVRGRLDGRERILRATGQVVFERGYAGLSIARISAVAGTSNQTFYENFANKEEVFMAAFDKLSLRAFSLTAAAVEGGDDDPLRGAAQGLLALLEHLARDPVHRQLVFVELTGAGPGPLARAEAMLDVFVGFLDPARLPPGAAGQPPLSVREAIGGGIWSIVRHEILAGRGARLAELAPAIIDFATIPFGREWPQRR